MSKTIPDKTEDGQKGNVALPKSVLAAFIILGILVVFGIGSAAYFYIQYQNAQRLLENPKAAEQTQAQELTSRVGRLIELPSNEQPQIDTVSDVTKLKDKPFFKDAKNGDKLLIYLKSQKLILYDPTVNKIVNVGFLNLAYQQVNAQSQSTPTSAPVKIAINNGTKTAGLATTTANELTSALQGIVVVSKGNTAKDYTQTIVVDITGKNSQRASQIASALHGKVGSLPAGEIKPTNTDILVIVGVGPTPTLVK